MAQSLSPSHQAHRRSGADLRIGAIRNSIAAAILTVTSGKPSIGREGRLSFGSVRGETGLLSHQSYFVKRPGKRFRYFNLFLRRECHGRDSSKGPMSREN